MIETSTEQRSTADLLRYLAERVGRMLQDLITDTAESSLAWPKPEHWQEQEAPNARPGTSPNHAAAEPGTATAI